MISLVLKILNHDTCENSGIVTLFKDAKSLNTFTNISVMSNGKNSPFSRPNIKIVQVTLFIKIWVLNCIHDISLKMYKQYSQEKNNRKSVYGVYITVLTFRSSYLVSTGAVIQRFS